MSAVAAPRAAVTRTPRRSASATLVIDEPGGTRYVMSTTTYGGAQSMAVSRAAQPAKSRTPTTPASDRAVPIDLLRLEDVDADDHDLARALVLRPVGDVPRLGDHVARVILLLVSALAAFGERAFQDVGK